ncbi:MAG TPA: lysophospholipid acyltransferase family protein [Ktedonobacteraceae bacterium]|nr:lysophospholipid acyltransferase family protein [Ktedonobacteraceae bacterium]
MEQVQAAKPAGKGRAEKNLYEPYKAPALIWSLIRLFGRLAFFILARIEVRGRENMPAKGPFIVASNHLSWFDVPLVPAFMKRQPFTMAKEELFHSNISWLVRFMGGFPVKRGEADRQAIRAADELLKKGDVLFIFPEGTRSRTHKLAKGHSGLGMIALRSGAPVIPVAIAGSENILKKIRPRVTLTFGEPMTFKPAGRKTTREDIENATDEVMTRIAAMLPTEYR